LKKERKKKSKMTGVKQLVICSNLFIYYEQDMPSLSCSLIIMIGFMKDGMNDGRLWLPYLGEKNNS